jgi:predicted transcriptional regulator
MTPSEENALDSVLITIENPVRRKIIRKLSMEPSYQLRISKELGFSQQLVAKHLDSMEDAGMVSSEMESSPHGPKRREYLLNRSISLTIDLAPNLFRTRVFAFEPLPDDEPASSSSEMYRALSEVIQRPDENRKLRPLGALINEIDRRLGGLEDEREVLLYLRHLAMKEVGRATAGMALSWDEKRPLSQLLEAEERKATGLSRRLDLSDAALRALLAEIEKSL